MASVESPSAHEDAGGLEDVKEDDADDRRGAVAVEDGYDRDSVRAPPALAGIDLAGGTHASGSPPPAIVPEGSPTVAPRRSMRPVTMAAAWGSPADQVFARRLPTATVSSTASRTHRSIASGSVPLRMLLPHSIVSGRSVVSRTVTGGDPEDAAFLLHGPAVGEDAERLALERDEVEEVERLVTAHVLVVEARGRAASIAPGCAGGR